MPETEKTPPDPLPGDLVQITVAARQGAIVVVETIRSWGVSGYAPAIVETDRPTADIPLRLKRGEFALVGTAAVMAPELLKARNAAIETARLLAREAEAKS